MISIYEENIYKGNIGNGSLAETSDNVTRQLQNYEWREVIELRFSN